MTAHPLASVVVATYDAAATLPRALESLVAQDYPAVEIVVVDDGSTDGTAALVERFPTVVWRRQANAGPSAARNLGISVARGEFVGFLDADDVAPPNKLSIQVGHLLENPDIGCVLGRQTVSSDSGELPSWIARDPVFGDLAGVPLMSMVVRRGVLEELGGFDPSLRLAEDRDLLVRMRHAGVGIDVVREVVLVRNFHDRNLSHARPDHHPLLRSLKANLDRQRAR